MYTLQEIIVIKLETLRGCKLQLLMNYYVPCMNYVRGHISTTYTIHTTNVPMIHGFFMMVSLHHKNNTLALIRTVSNIFEFLNPYHCYFNRLSSDNDVCKQFKYVTKRFQLTPEVFYLINTFVKNYYLQRIKC